MSEENICNLVLDIMFGLQYIYKKGIMYWDFKFLNILIYKDKRVKIGDFGIVRKCKIFFVDGIFENGFF